MAIEIFSIVIAIAICHVALVVASVEVRAMPGFCSAIIGIVVAASQSGAVVSEGAAPDSGSITAFKPAGRTIAAPETWAATVASAPQCGSAAAAIASASKAGSASATTRTSATATVVADEIDKVGACIGRGLQVQHWRRICDSRA
jgi:hypothetical protein